MFKINGSCTRVERILRRIEIPVIVLSNEILVIIKVEVKERLVDSER